MLTNSAVRLNGFVLYESVADKVNYSPFLKGCQMPDTFYSWFTVTELHVWMLLVRAMDIPDDGRFLRNMIVEAMWNDVQTRSKKLEGTGSARREQVSELGDQFTAALLSYDEGLLGSDIDLANALWRTLFQKNDVHPHALEAAVHLVRKQVQLLDEIDDETFLLKGGKSIAWCELPLPKTS
ncbi:ubiquinol-cytochrome c reductase complex assembly factor 1-like isoform X2 [Artemia franciscana]|uniref:ubiquinol-cytochrome c reductase complex assembly factor 1-like isoform X2 n=1 Tax=Artemia franciscana TaxID=6661 RepID=UPI0032DB56E6